MSTTKFRIDDFYKEIDNNEPEIEDDGIAICDVCLEAKPKTLRYWKPSSLRYINGGRTGRFYCNTCSGKKVTK